MFKIVARNYYKKFGYFGVVFAFFCLAVIAGALVFLLGIFLPYKNLYPALYSDVVNYITNFFTNLTARDIIDSAFLKDFFWGIASHFDGYGTSIKVWGIIAIALTVAAFLGTMEGGEALSRWLIRRKLYSENTVRGFKAVIIRLAFTIALHTANFIVTFFWFYFIFLIPIVSLVLNSLKEMLVSYVIFYRHKSLKEIFNAKDIFSYIGVRFFAVILSYIAIVLTVLQIGAMYALIIILPFNSYNSVIVDVSIPMYYNQKLEIIVKPAKTPKFFKRRKKSPKTESLNETVTTIKSPTEE